MTLNVQYPPRTTLEKNPLANSESLEHRRRARLAEHLKGRFCATEELTSAEEHVDALLRQRVTDCYEASREKADFGLLGPFHAIKSEIEKTNVFALLKRMPKGGLLHVHLGAAGRMDWVINNALTAPNCHVHWPLDPTKDRGKLLFATPEAAKQRKDYFSVVSKVEEFAAQGQSFARALRAVLTIHERPSSSRERLWAEFGKLFERTNDFIRYRPVFTDYLLDVFRTLWDDGIYYVELRDSFDGLYGLNQQRGRMEELVGQVITARELMREKHPEFDCRLILAVYRGASVEEIHRKFEDAVRLRTAFGNLIIGFDLVGEEFNCNDNTYVKLDALIRKCTLASSLKPACEADFALAHELPYFLHGGESAWADNENLIDALLLGPLRIGHAFNLFRFPSLIPLIKANDIALEICPISNQLLGLAPDLRTHPAAGYLNAGIQCTLSSDDPMYFGNDGLSYDFWEALVAWNLDLRALKRLARNSIVYAGLDPASKAGLLSYWERQWDHFISNEAAQTL